MIPTSVRRHAVTAVLVALTAVLAVFVFVWDRGSVSTSEAENRKKNLFEAWRRDDLTEVRVVAKGRSGTLRRRAGDSDARWEIELDPGGPRRPADEQVVDQYLGTLEFAAAERRIAPESVDRSAFGLDAPRVTVTMVMGKLAYRLLLGGPSPTPPGSAYAEVEGRGVFVVTSQLAEAIDVAPDAFRSRTLVPHLSVDLAGLEISGEGGPRRFERAPWSGGRGAGFRWAAGTAHAGLRVSARALDKTFVALGQLQAARFLDDAAVEGVRDAGEPARVTVRLVPRPGVPGGDRPGILEIGADCPGEPELVLVRRREPDPVAACAPRSTLVALTEPAESFVDLRLVGAELDEITEVAVTHGDRRLEMARAGAGWHLRAPADRDVPADVGRGIVEAMLAVSGARVQGGATDAELGLAPPRATVRLMSPQMGSFVDAGADRVEQLDVGSERSDGTVVRRVEDGALLRVPSAAARSLIPDDLGLRDRALWNAKARRIRSLRIARRGTDDGQGNLVQRAERGGEGPWTLVEPRGTGLAADTSSWNEVAEVLAGLRAERWVADAAAPEHGLDRPRLVVEAELEPDGRDAGADARSLRLEIGAPTPGGAFARRGGPDGAVFVVPAVLEAAAGRLLLDRHALSVDVGKVRRVTLSRDDGKRAKIEREGDTWKLVEPAADPGASSTVAKVIAALDDLVAEGAVSFGEARKEEGLEKPRLSIELELSPPASPVRLLVGAGDSFRGTSIRYVRRDGLAVTYALAQSKVDPLLAAF